MRKYKQIKIFNGHNVFYAEKNTNEWLKINDNKVEIEEIKYDFKQDSPLTSTHIVTIIYNKFDESE